MLLVRRAFDDGSAPAGARAALLAKIATLPRGVVRGLFENLMTPEQRGPKLADVASVDEILKLTPDVANGERLFASGSLSARDSIAKVVTRCMAQVVASVWGPT